MSRTINTELPAQRRQKLMGFISNSVLLLNNQIISNQDKNDLIAFIILSLAEIEKTIIHSTTPWERRDYWVKADQFRNEWGWVGEVRKQLLQCKTAQGWILIPFEIQFLKDKTKNVKPLRKIGNDFWKNAFEALSRQE